MTIDPTALSAFTASPLPPVNQAALPADVRNGTKAQKQAYQAALGFEQMLVNQLTQTMLSSATNDSSTSGSSSDGSDGSSSDSTTTLYQQLLPEQLSQAITASGGLGLADQIYKSLEGQAK